MADTENGQDLAIYVEGTTIVIEGDQGGMARISGSKGLWLLEKLARKVRSVR